MREVVIGEPVRTALGRRDGMCSVNSAGELGVAALSGLSERAAIPHDAIEDAIVAQCYPTMEAPALGRVVALDAGLPIETPGIQIDRRCGSGLQAVNCGVMQVQTGGADLVVPGRAESMSNAAFFTHASRTGLSGSGIIGGGQGLTAVFERA